MRIEFRGFMPSRQVEENKPAEVEVKVEQPRPQRVGKRTGQQRSTKDDFTPDPRPRPAQRQYYGGTATPPPPVLTNVAPQVPTHAPITAQANTPASVPAAALSPAVQAAVDDINKYQPGSQAYGLNSALEAHGSNSPQDVTFRKELMAALGPDRVAELMGQVRNMPNDGPAFARTFLSAAAEAYPPADQGKLVQALGKEMLGAALATGVELAGTPDTLNREKLQSQMQGLAKMVGSLSSLPPGSPGQAEVTGMLDRLKNDEPRGKAPGVTTAAWLVANSGNDTLRSSFANGFIAAFKADPASLSPEEARATAWALGSMSQSPANALGPIVDIPQKERSQFLALLGSSTAAEGPAAELRMSGAGFQDDVHKGVSAFLEDVASLKPSDFPNPQAATDLRIAAFQQVSLALGGPFFGFDEGTHLALAHIFAADTANLVNASINGDLTNPFYDAEAQAMSKFFDHVAFRDAGSRDVVTQALQQYLGTATTPGIVTKLVEGQGSDQFMKQEGGILLARNLGFVLGALCQGSQSAMQAMDDELARQTAIVDVLGSVVETAIESTPGVSGAYSKIKDGTGDQASVDTVFKWLSKQFGGELTASKEGVANFTKAVIGAAWRPFFGDTALMGAGTQDLQGMYGMINSAVSLADGNMDAGINFGGAPTN